MTENRVYLQPSYILQQRYYRETSLIVDVFTRDFGRVSMLAKGVRTAKSKTQGLLQPFIPLNLTFSGKSELKALADIELAGPFKPLQGLNFYCGFYVNELTTGFLHKDDPHPELFADYVQCLGELQDKAGFDTVLRNYELNLIEKTGYGLQLVYDYIHDKPVDPLKKYHLNSDLSPVEAEDGFYTGNTLKAIQARDFSEPVILAEAKALLRRVINIHLQGKPLNSRKVLNEIMKRL